MLVVRVKVTREQSLKLRQLLRRNRKFTNEDIKKHASALRIAPAKCRIWLKQRNAIVEDEKPAAATLLKSTQVQSKRKGSKFFDALPYEKQIVLLRKTTGKYGLSNAFVQELIDELDVNPVQLRSWLKHKKARNLYTDRQLTPENVEVLKQEYKKSNILDDDKALMLSNQFDVPVSMLKKWFADTRAEEQTVEDNILSEIITESGVKFKSPRQKVIMFEEFKRSPSCTTPGTISRLVEATNLEPNQVSKFLSCFRVKCSQTTEAEVKKALLKNMSQQQLSQLEKLYRKCRFLSNIAIKNAAKELNSNYRVLKPWFSNRRIYEVLSHDKDLVFTDNKKQPVDKSVSFAQGEERLLESDYKAEPQKITSEDDRFFKSLSKHQQMTLMKASTSYNTSYRRIANQLGLPADKVASWIKNKRLFEGIHLVVPGNKDTLTEKTLEILKARYQQSTNISSKQAVLLAKQLKMKPTQVKTWFQNRRKRDRALALARQSISGKTESADLPEGTETGAESIKREIETHIKTQPAESETEPEIERRSTIKRQRKDITQKNALFEEYKKSPQLTISRVNALSTKLHLTPLQIRKWFSNFRQRAIAQPEEKILKCIQNEAIGAEKIATLEQEYRRNRFITERKNDLLAEQLNVSKKLVKNWFINARYYELLTGTSPGPAVPKPDISDTTFYKELQPEKQSRLDDHLKSFPFNDEKLQNLATELDVPSENLKKALNNASASKIVRRKPQLRYGTGKINRKKLNILKAEFEKNEVITHERAKALCSKVKVSMDRIKTWFENRRKLKAERENALKESSDDQDSPMIEESSDEPTSASTPVSKNKSTSAAPKVGEIVISSNQTSREAQIKEVTSVPEIKAGSAPSTQNNFKLPFYQNRLYEEFKKSADLPDATLQSLIKDLGLSGRHIIAWYEWMRAKFNSVTKESLLNEIRNFNFTDEQIAVLEKEYRKSRYTTREGREELACKLGVSRSDVKLWFANKRYYEILCNRENPEEDELSAQEDNPELGTEAVIDYDWDDENAKEEKSGKKKSAGSKRPNSDSCEKAVQRELEFTFVESIENIPIVGDEEVDTSQADIDNAAAEGTTPTKTSQWMTEDCTSLPYEPRTRFVAHLRGDLEPIDHDVESLFWFIRKTPNRKDPNSNEEISKEKSDVLEIEFEKNPWPELDRITVLSKELKVSEPKIHWWFVKKRCFLTKTIVTVPSISSKPAARSKNLVIDLTDEDANAEKIDNNESTDPVFEFVALDEPEIKKEIYVDETALENENDEMQPNDIEMNDIIDPMEENHLDPEENADSKDSDPTKTTSPKKKKKKIAIALTSHQRAILLQEFRRCKFISGPKARMLANDLGLSVSRVDSWFENMRNSAERKANPSEMAAIAKEKFTPEVVAELEKEFQRSQNLSEKRAKMIALKLNIRKKMVRYWFFERVKKKDE